MPAMLASQTALNSALGSYPARDPIWLRVGHLFRGDGEVIRDAHLVYDAEQILYIGRAGELPPAAIFKNGPAQPAAELPEYTALPGLIEAHGHLFLDGHTVNLEQRQEYLKKDTASKLARARSRLSRLVRLGVMAVRDAGDKEGIGLALQREYAARNATDLQPYIDSPGAPIHRKGRYGSFMGEPLENFENAEACVEARCRAGARRIKVITSGIVNFERAAVTVPPQMSASEVSDVVTAARRRGRQTFAHASGAEGIENAIEGGVTSIEHGIFVTDEQLTKMSDRSIAWVPTHSPIQAQIDYASEMGWNQSVVDGLRRMVDAHAASVRTAHARGVTLLAGSDAGSGGVPHGVGLLHELELMEQAGLAPQVVLRSATGASSDVLGFTEKLGRLAVGYRARFILSRHRPLDSVSNLRRERLVVFDGMPMIGNAETDATGL